MYSRPEINSFLTQILQMNLKLLLDKYKILSTKEQQLQNSVNGDTGHGNFEFVDIRG